jgi:hypothetical protein
MFNAPSEAAAEAAGDAAADAAVDAAALLGADDEDEPEEHAARPSTATEAKAMDAVSFAYEVMVEG